jgi:hypothetical protein
MKIAVVGAGWLGCHMAHKLKNKHEVSLFDQEGIFSGISKRNQNRLHLGYHYARNSTTRQMCKNTFYKFEKDYGHLLSLIPQNIYAVPYRNSLLDFKTYIKIFDNYDFQITDVNYLANVSGVLNVGEKYINPFFAENYFTKELHHLLTIQKIENIDELSKSYNLVINCTNNHLNPITRQSFMEPGVIFVYEKIQETPFDALTLVDGQFFSIFPFYTNMVTVTDVEYSPDANLNNLQRVQGFEEKAVFYYPDFHKKFKYHEMLKVVKAKPVDKSDSRAPVITMENNIINCFSGKIQGIYYLEDYVRQVCEF